MKKVILTVVFGILTMAAQANVAFEIKGELIVDNSSHETEVVLVSDNGNELKIVGAQLDPSACKEGSFQVVSNYFPAGTYTLLKVVECSEKNLDSSKINWSNTTLSESDSSYDSVICPEIYMPVCGEATIGGTKVEKTFGNKCELDAHNAKMISKGECRFTDEILRHGSRRIEGPAKNPNLYR